MAAINFPAASESPWYNPSNGITYEYIGGTWRAVNALSDSFDDEYVEIAGDNMTGNLTIGPEGGPEVIKLANDGSASFNSTVTAYYPGVGGNIIQEWQSDYPSNNFTKARLYANGTLSIGGGTDDDGSPVFRVGGLDGATYIGGDIIGGSPNISLNADGSADFSGYIECSRFSPNRIFLGDGIGGKQYGYYHTKGDGTLAAGIALDGSAEFTGSVKANGGVAVDGGSQLSAGFYYRDDAGESGLALYKNGSLQENRKVFIKSDGSAKFSSFVEVNRETSGSLQAALVGLASSSGDYTSSVGTTYGIVIQEVAGANASGCFLGANGNYYFAGTGNVRGLVIETEADNPANYVSTTDSEGNQTQVYNGPTLDVKERLTKADVALQNLKSAVATAVDFAELKAAMTTALADI